jgi:selenocysteine-specific elongation factor
MEEGRQAMSELIDSGQVIPLEAEIKDIPTLLARDSLVCSRVFLEQIKNQIILEIDRYHAFYPLRRGMSREELKSKIGLQTRVYQALLRWIVSSGELIEIGALIARAGFAVRFDTEQLKLIERVLNQFYASPAAPPSVKEVQAELGGELLMAVLDQGLLVQVTTDVIFSKTGYDQMVSDVIKLLQKSETISAGQVRDHFNTSRRYVLALLEHMDQVGITVRLGDVRRLRK